MNRYSIIPVRDEFGRLIPGVLVYVYEWDFPSQSTGALSALYDDDGITPLLNPLTTDEFGAAYFNASGGMKLLEYHFAGRLYYREQIIVDPVGSEPLGLIPSKSSRPGKYLAWDTNGDAVVSSGTGADAGLRTDLAASTGSALIGFLPLAGGGVPRSIRSRLSDIFNAIDYGATSSVAAAGIIAALSATPALGGKVEIPAGSWALASDPTTSIGTKSIFFDIHPDAVFTGAGSGEGKFGYMATNAAQLAVGPYHRSQSHQKSTNANGGIAAFNVEMLQPSDYGAGQSVGIYAGAQISCANASANGWAANFLGVAQSAALGKMTVLEIDANNFSASATVKGLSISGAGSQNATMALEITRASMAWGIGLTIAKATDAVVITPNAAGRGIAIHSPTALVQGVPDAGMSARQFSNNKDTIFLQRFTDSSPTGYFARAVNAANNANLFSIGINGDFSMAGLIASGGVSLSGLGNYASDAAAATGGVAVNQLYRNGSVVQVRVS